MIASKMNPKIWKWLTGNASAEWIFSRPSWAATVPAGRRIVVSANVPALSRVQHQEDRLVDSWEGEEAEPVQRSRQQVGWRWHGKLRSDLPQLVDLPRHQG